jgi:nitroreductase
MSLDDLRMPLVEAMETQRAIRRLRPDPVDDALLRRLIELALNAPTGGNLQSWEFVVVRDPRVKARLARQNRIAWRVYGAWSRWATRRNAKQRRMVDAVQWQADHFEELPVLVVACLHHPHPPFWNFAKSGYYGSIYPAVQNLLLAARAVGLGAALITLPLWSTWAVRRILELPWTVTPCALVPLGWPHGRYGPNHRRPVGDVVSIDRYGNREWKTSPTAPPRPRESESGRGEDDA